jgi:response regulator NasT
MLVDEQPERRAFLQQALLEVDCALVGYAAPEENLLLAVEHSDPDVIIIDMESPSRDTLESLRSVHLTVPRAMVMFTQDDRGESIRRAVDAGVSAYVVDGLSMRRVRPILEAAIARFRQFRALASELEKARSQLAERKVIEKAKGLIMDKRGLSEHEAYQAMRRLAMSRNKRLADVAEGIVAAAELLG